MAVFDSSGCPSDFLAIIRHCESDIQEQKNLIAKEKQLIEDAEKQIAEKVKLTKGQEVKNAELESSIEHMHALYIKQLENNKRLRDTKEILKQQVSIKSEKLEMVKEKNQRIKSDCEIKYKWYAEQYVERMSYYETLPLVPEFKEKMCEIVELHGKLTQIHSCSESLNEEIKDLKEKNDNLKPKFSLVEWGVKLATLYQEYNDFDQSDDDVSLATLRKEVDILKLKKSSIEEEQKQAAADNLSLPGSSADMKVESNLMITNDEDPKYQITNKPICFENASCNKQYSVPDFRSFFKDQPPKVRKYGSSGSSLKGSNDFEISAMQKKQDLFNLKTSQAHVARNDQSNSLFTALDKDKPQVKKSEVSKVGSFKTGRSLAEWLNPPLQTNQEMQDERTEATPSTSEKDTSAKDNLKTRSFPAGHSQSRITEIPLLRQVQEKMLLQKRVSETEPTLTTENTNSIMDVSSTSIQSDDNNESNRLTMFDGPSYEVVMSNDESPAPSSSTTSEPSKSPGRRRFEEHQLMMIELQKSPEDFFHLQSNVMPMEGGDNAFLISPTPPSPIKSLQQSPAKSAVKNDFQFAIPTNLPPGHSKRNPTPVESQFAGFSEEQGHSSNFPSFSFGFNQESSSDSGAFSFGSSAPEPEASASESNFSFSFGKNDATSPPESGNSAFSLGSSSPGKSPVSFFSLKSDEKDESSASSSSFASLFGF